VRVVSRRLTAEGLDYHSFHRLRLLYEWLYVILHIFSVCYAYKGQRNPKYRSTYQLQRSYNIGPLSACLCDFFFSVQFPTTAITALMYCNINPAQYSWRYYSLAEVICSTLSHDFSHSDSWSVGVFKWMCGNYCCHVHILCTSF